MATVMMSRSQQIGLRLADASRYGVISVYALAAFAVTVIAGCGDQVIETPLGVARSLQTPCTATVEGTARPMNTYVVDLHLDLDTKNDATASRCCIDRIQCPRLQRRCVCTPAKPTEAGVMADALRDLRFQDVSEDGPYCVRVVALETTAGRTSEDGECVCQSEWLLQVDEKEYRLRGCAVTPEGFVLEQDNATLDLRCLDDHALGPGGTETPLGQCLGPLLFTYQLES